MVIVPAAGLPRSSSSVYSMGVGLPSKASSGVKMISPVSGSTVHVPSPGTTSSVTGSPSSRMRTLSGSMPSPVASATTSTTTGESMVPPFTTTSGASGAVSGVLVKVQLMSGRLAGIVNDATVPSPLETTLPFAWSTHCHVVV